MLISFISLNENLIAKASVDIFLNFISNVKVGRERVRVSKAVFVKTIALWFAYKSPHAGRKMAISEIAISGYLVAFVGGIHKIIVA